MRNVFKHWDEEYFLDIYFKVVVVWSFIATMYITAVFVASCVEEKDKGVFAYHLDEVYTNGKTYQCDEPDNKNLVRASSILISLVYKTSSNPKEAIRLLLRHPVGLCYVSGYEYLICDEGAPTGLVKAVGCYDGYTKAFWMTRDCMVHELVHHYIHTTLVNDEDRSLSHIHRHPIQLYHEHELNKEFN